MNLRCRNLFFVFSVGSSLSLADDRKQRVVDLGEIQTQSSVRRPNLRTVESDSNMKQILPNIYQSQFESMEQEYLNALSQGESHETR